MNNLITGVFTKLVSLIPPKLLFFLWAFAHFLFDLAFVIYQETRSSLRQVKNVFFQCLPSHSAEAKLKRFAHITRDLNKTPKHLAFLIINKSSNEGSSVGGVFRTLLTNLNLVNYKKKGEEVKGGLGPKGEEQGGTIDLHEVAKLVLWAWMANIHHVTLYDYNGVLKSCHRKLCHIIHEEIVGNLWAMRQSTVPSLKFHNVPHTNGYTNGYSNGGGNGLNGVRDSTKMDNLHISLYSSEDGKGRIVQVAKNICKQRLSREDGGLEIREGVVGAELNELLSGGGSVESIKTEPDLLVILGGVKSTLGFLPWHIRLTEFHWLPTVEKVELEDLSKCLNRYAGTQQRFGT